MPKTLAIQFIDECDAPAWQKDPINKTINKATSNFHSIMYSQVDFMTHFYDKNTPLEYFKMAAGYMVVIYDYNRYIPWRVHDDFYHFCSYKLTQQMADYPNVIANIKILQQENERYFNRYHTIRKINKAYGKHGNYGDDTDFEFYMLKYYKFLFLSLEILRPFCDQQTHDDLCAIYHHLSLCYSYLYDVQMYTKNAFIIDVFPKLYKYQWLNHIPIIRRPLTYSALCAKDEFKKIHGMNTFMYSNLALEPYVMASEHYMRFLNKAQAYMETAVAISQSLERRQQSKTKRASKMLYSMVVNIQQLKQEHDELFKDA